MTIPAGTWSRPSGATTADGRRSRSRPTSVRSATSRASRSRPTRWSGAFKARSLRGTLFPVTCGAASRNVGTRALLDLIVDGLPSPARRAHPRARRARDDDVVLELEGSGVAAYASRRSPTPTSAASACLRVFSGTLRADVPLGQRRAPAQGAHRAGARGAGQGAPAGAPSSDPATSAPCPSSRTSSRATCWPSTDDRAIDPVPLPAPVVSVAVEPKTRGEDEKMATALRRLAEEDPTLRVSRDERTGELLVRGLSQMHIEVTVERVKRRFGVEVTHASAARPVPRGDPQEGARSRPLQEADRRPRAVRRLPHRGRAAARRTRATSSSTRSSAASSRGSYRPAVDQGVQETMANGRARRLSGSSASRDARRRPLPRGRPLGDGVQDRRLDGVQEGLRRGRSRAARAQSWPSR